MSRKTFVGIVVKASHNKTVKVLVRSLVRHKLYGKFMTKYSKYMVHDEYGKCNIGDTVKICEHSPISSTKKWVVY